jgi:molybdate/tungstate transport system substrate-binding protein
MTYSSQGYARTRCCRWASLIIASALGTACSSAGERAVQDSAAMAVDSGDTAPRRIASDATLVLANVSRLTVPLRAAADSFGVDEAVSVRQETVDTAGLGELGKTADIIALSADLFPQTLIPARTSWYVRFARDRIVLAYGDSSRGAATIDSTNWWKVLQRRGVRVGRADPAADPAGYRALLVMELAASHYEQPTLAAALRRASSAATIRPTEAALVAGLDSLDLDYIWTHESTARAANLRYLRLPPEIDLGEPADSVLYAAAEVVVPRVATDTARPDATSDTTRASVQSLADTVTMRGAPILYGISILNDAPSPRHAERFLRYLFSDAGRRVLESAHLDVLPRPTVVGADVPPTIRASLGEVATPAPAAADTARDTAKLTQRKQP